MADANAVSQVVVRGAQGARSAASKAEHGGGAFDVWSRAKEGYPTAVGQTAGFGDMPISSIESGTSVGALPTAMGQHVDALKQAGLDILETSGLRKSAADSNKTTGVLATVGAVVSALTALEQTISTPLSTIPFPAYPAIRVMDMAVGWPHAHPPIQPAPMPSMGPVIPLPYVSGAATVLINGMPAGRCGDMGMALGCGGVIPLFEIFLGSASVWIEGMRAARLGVDITRHCIFQPPVGVPFGMTVSASANVVIGGVPMPSLTNIAIGAAVKFVFAGIGKKLRGLRSARAAKEVAEANAKAAKEAATAAETKVAKPALLQLPPGPAPLLQLPVFSKSTVEDVITSSRRPRNAQITEGARALQKKHGHASAAGQRSAFDGIKPTQENAEKIINDALERPSRVFRGEKVTDVYDSSGHGVRFERDTGRFIGFLEEGLATQ